MYRTLPSHPHLPKDRKEEYAMINWLLTNRWRIIFNGILVLALPILGLALFVYVNVTHELERLSSEKQQVLAYSAAHILEEKLRSEMAFATAYSTRYLLI